MKPYWANRLFRIGAFLALIGWTPLLGIVLLAEIGVWPDPNPNPVGPGILFFVTFWPAVILLVIGALQVRLACKSRDEV
jgi:hypothetical protein